jgi:glycosyltransferase involved in cell wall biosynthesis
MSISVLILTKNEEADLPDCLESVAWSDDVHVFDSGSTDRTAELATAAGATVTVRPFVGGYATHRNAALRELAFRHEWLLILDADERVPAGLRDEMRAALSTAPADLAGFRIRRRDFLFGRWLKHAQISPFYIRLVRPGRVHYEREINEVLVPDGPVAELREPFDHFPFSKGIAHWIDKHNRYSTMEAARWFEEQTGGTDFRWSKALFARDFSQRRYHQKGLFYRLSGRPILKLLYMLLARRAFLDGGPGITYSLLQSIYEYFIVLKQREIIRQSQRSARRE